MKIAIGSDEKTAVTEFAVRRLRELGHEPILFGPLLAVDGSWPAVAGDVAQAVVSGDANEAILFCWTGTGVSIAANKVPGIRAALCADAETARGARLWNDANVLCLSLRLTTEALVDEIFKQWFGTDYRPNQEDDACLTQLNALEAKFVRK